jgi:hypothetical protein
MARFSRVVLPDYPHNIKKSISLFITSFIFAGVICMSTAFGSGNDFTNYRKAWFTIEFEAQQMGLDIRVNDIPVFNIDDTGFMTLELPVNEYLINGDNEVSVTAHPLFDGDDEQMGSFVENTKVEVGLYIREEDENSEKRKLIDKVLIRPEIAYWESSNEPVARFIGDIKSENHTSLQIVKDADVLSYPGYGVFNKQVTTTWKIKSLETTLPRWAWQDGQNLTNDEASYQSLLNAYRRLYNAFKDKDINEVKKIAQERSKELAVAYYLGDSDAGFEYSAVSKDINHPTIELYEKLALHNSKFELLGHGKLARIMNAAHTHPILFLDYENEQTYKHQFMWYKNKNNEWVLIR